MWVINFLKKIKEKRRLIKERKLKNIKTQKLKKEYGGKILYPEDKRIDVFLIYLKEVGVLTSDDKSNPYYFFITFKDGTKLKAWNSNKWDCWMSYGVAEFSNGEKFEWEQKSPSYETLIAFKNLFNKSEDIDDDYTKFLPLKVKRRMKLKKIKK